MWSALLLVATVLAQQPAQAAAPEADPGPWTVVDPAPGNPRKALVVTSGGRPITVGEGLRAVGETRRLGDRVRSAESVLGAVGAWAARVGIVGVSSLLGLAGIGVAVLGVVMVLMNRGSIPRPRELGSGADFVLAQAPGWVGGGLVAIATALAMVGVLVVLEVWHVQRGPRPPDPVTLEETASSTLWDPEEARHAVQRHNEKLRGTP